MPRFIGEQIIPMHLKEDFTRPYKSKEEERESLRKNTTTLLQGTERMRQAECDYDWLHGAEMVEWCAQNVGAYELLELVKNILKPEMSRSERENILIKIRKEATDVVQCLHERFEQAEAYNLFQRTTH